MKKITLLMGLVVALLCVGMLAACNTQTTDPQDTTEVGTDTADTTTSGTTADTEAATEAETFPRYDYFEADVLSNVDVKKEDYEAITLKLGTDLLVTEEEVQNYIVYLQFQERVAVNGETQVKDQALKMGDTAYIYYKGTVDGVAFEGGSNMEDESPYALGLGSGSFIDGFESGLVGVVPNTTSKDEPFALTVTFPKNYSNTDLAGKEAVFYVVVEYAVQYTMPEYNRDFVENTLKFEATKDHVTDGSYLKEFEDYLKTYLEEQNASYADSAKTDALWTYMTDLIECQNLSQDEINYYYASYKNEIQSAYDYYASYGGEEFKKLYDTVGKFAVAYMGFGADADWEAELDRLARLLVKKDMIIHAIAELEGIEVVTDKEMEEEIEYWIEYYGGYVTKEEVLKNIGESYLKESAFAVKMYDFLMAKVTFVYED